MSHSNHTLSLTLSALVSLSCLLLTGCNIGKPSAPSQFYRLGSANVSQAPLVEQAWENSAIGVASVVVPSHLDRPQMVSQKNNYEITYDEFSRWAEPLSTGATRVVRENLAHLLQSNKVYAAPWSRSFDRDYEVHIIISELTVKPTEQQVVFNAIWRISSSTEKINFASQESNFAIPFSGSDTTAKISAITEALEKLSYTLAQNILSLEGSISE